MAIKYLYIDDNADDLVEGQVSALNVGKSELEVQHRQPLGAWENERKYFEDDFSKEYDGLILDLRLDDEKNKAGLKSNYKGTSLAQELRTLSKEGIINETPIILLSATDKIIESLDATGKDLFDVRIPKERLEGEVFEETRKKLIALANGYKKIASLKNEPISQKWFLGLLDVNPNKVDERFVTKVMTFHSHPTHSLISFLIETLFSSDGPLISEWTMAARLGIDIEISTDWRNLLESLGESKYNGVLCGGWPKWWTHLFDDWLIKNFKDAPFRTTKASQRVELLRNFTGLHGLKAAERLPYSQSSLYWTICRGSGKPIDLIDGLVIRNQENLFPWQEKKYVSIDEALNRRGHRYWENVATSEVERLRTLQKRYSKDNDH